MFKIFIVLFTLSLSTFVEYKLYMLNSWMFIHHTVKKQINLWTKMFLNKKSSFSVDTKVFIYLYMYYLSWYVFYINNMYMYILSLVLLNRYTNMCMSVLYVISRVMQSVCRIEIGSKSMICIYWWQLTCCLTCTCPCMWKGFGNLSYSY